MKVERPKIMNTTEASASESTESVQPEKSPQPKTDSVEIKTNSFYNFDQPALDANKTNLSDQGVAATLMPGVPFREKVEIAKTLPDGQPVDGGLGKDPTGQTWTGPNRLGINMDGIHVRNQLDDALKLRQGTKNSAPSESGNYQPVTASDIGTHGNTAIDQGLNIQRGMDKVSAGKDNRGPGERIVDTVVDAAKSVYEAAKNVTLQDVKEAIPKAVDKVVEYARDAGVQKFGPPLSGEAMQLLDAPGKVKEVTGDEKDLVRGMAATMYPEARLDRIYNESNDNKYVNPEADSTTPQVTDELLQKVLIRDSVNTTPANDDTPAVEIDPSKLTPLKQFENPKLQMVADPRLDDQSTMVSGSPESVEVRESATGPDTVNPDEKT